MPSYLRPFLKQLEAESIFVMREVAAQFERPIILFSGGKDSILLVQLARRAFYPGRIPFPLLHIDTGHNFAETLVFRDQLVREMDAQLVVRYVQDSIDQGRVVEEKGPDRQSQWPADRHPARRPDRVEGRMLPLAAHAGMRKRRVPRSVFSPTATALANGTRKTSGLSFGASTMAANTRVSTFGSFP